jgi:predicted transcriptional regulator
MEDKKFTNEELEYFQNKLKETMGKGLPKKYLETTDLGEVDKEYEHRFKEQIEKYSTDVDRIKNMIDDSKQIND